VQTADGSGVMKLQSNGVTTNALAWVNFNGTGTVAIRSSYNVSSITDNGTGQYTVNFTTALSDANYAAFVTVRPDGSNLVDTACIADVTTGTYTTSAVRVWTGAAASGTARDANACCVGIFGN
jgi:fructose-1,6-bisphosphatase/inositol monophosphatase family enzyme